MFILYRMCEYYLYSSCGLENQICSVVWLLSVLFGNLPQPSVCLGEGGIDSRRLLGTIEGS